MAGAVHRRGGGAVREMAAARGPLAGGPRLCESALDETEKPEPKYGEARLRVMAAGVNPVDVFTRQSIAYNKMAEVVVHGAARHPGSVADRVQRRARVPLGGEQFARRRDEALVVALVRSCWVRRATSLATTWSAPGWVAWTAATSPAPVPGRASILDPASLPPPVDAYGTGPVVSLRGPASSPARCFRPPPPCSPPPAPASRSGPAGW
jgi:hypothetical protein